MIRKKILAFAFLMLCLCPLSLVRAADETDATQFFSSIQDVPLMPGLRELSDQTVAFDKPEGRIVESVALIRPGAQENLPGFYDETLPQLGWTRLGALSFRRESEILKMSVETLEGQKFLRVSVSPASSAAN